MDSVGPKYFFGPEYYIVMVNAVVEGSLLCEHFAKPQTQGGGRMMENKNLYSNFNLLLLADHISLIKATGLKCKPGLAAKSTSKLGPAEYKKMRKSWGH